MKSRWAKFPVRGAVLNTVCVLFGSCLGLLLGSSLDAGLQQIALSGLGLVTVAMGARMVIKSDDMLLVSGSLLVGGILGKLMGIDKGLAAAAEGARSIAGAGSQFNAGFVAATVLFCVGPMTLLGCIQDGLEHKIELISVKSMLDLVAATFMAAGGHAFGLGVLASTVSVLVIQSILTLFARPLSPLSKNEGALSDLTGTGGLILIAIALGLLGIKQLPTEVFLPALVFAPLTKLAIEKRNRPSNG